MPENTLNDTNQNTDYTVTLDEDGDELMLPIPDVIMDELGWGDGDLLEWIVEGDQIVLRKVEE
jgi:bifunctional DNA-binding transcriptional regulator/antitoxin component of YhaV-PrlF toxin-antitoxin module